MFAQNSRTCLTRVSASTTPHAWRTFSASTSRAAEKSMTELLAEVPLELRIPLPPASAHIPVNKSKSADLIARIRLQSRTGTPKSRLTYGRRGEESKREASDPESQGSLYKKGDAGEVASRERVRAEGSYSGGEERRRGFGQRAGNREGGAEESAGRGFGQRSGGGGSDRQKAATGGFAQRSPSTIFGGDRPAGGGFGQRNRGGDQSTTQNNRPGSSSKSGFGSRRTDTPSPSSPAPASWQAEAEFKPVPAPVVITRQPKTQESLFGTQSLLDVDVAEIDVEGSGSGKETYKGDSSVAKASPDSALHRALLSIGSYTHLSPAPFPSSTPNSLLSLTNSSSAKANKEVVHRFATHYADFVMAREGNVSPAQRGVITGVVKARLGVQARDERMGTGDV